MPTPRASSNEDGGVDSLSSGARAAVLILVAKIRWCINKQCARLYLPAKKTAQNKSKDGCKMRWCT